MYVDRNVCSGPSWLIGEQVKARLYIDHGELWYGRKKVAEAPHLPVSSCPMPKVTYASPSRLLHSQAHRPLQNVESGVTIGIPVKAQKGLHINSGAALLFSRQELEVYFVMMVPTLGTEEPTRESL